MCWKFLVCLYVCVVTHIQQASWQVGGMDLLLSTFKSLLIFFFILFLYLETLGHFFSQQRLQMMDQHPTTPQLKGKFDVWTCVVLWKGTLFHSQTRAVVWLAIFPQRWSDLKKNQYQLLTHFHLHQRMAFSQGTNQQAAFNTAQLFIPIRLRQAICC